jgi:hypothetical protein
VAIKAAAQIRERREHERDEHGAELAHFDLDLIDLRRAVIADIPPGSWSSVARYAGRALEAAGQNYTLIRRCAHAPVSVSRTGSRFHWLMRPRSVRSNQTLQPDDTPLSSGNAGQAPELPLIVRNKDIRRRSYDGMSHISEVTCMRLCHLLTPIKKLSVHQ